VAVIRPELGLNGRGEEALKWANAQGETLSEVPSSSSGFLGKMSPVSSSLWE